MSATYLRQVELVEAEFRTALSPARFILENWHRQDVIERFAGSAVTTRQSFLTVAENLEATYFVRLFARFEGLLESHLRTNHPSTDIPRDRKVDWLIATVDKRERIRLGPNWRRRYEQIRTTRNNIAHGRMQLTVTFDEAKAVLAKFVDRMPEPRRRLQS